MLGGGGSGGGTPDAHAASHAIGAADTVFPTGTGLQGLRRNAANSGLEFVDLPTGGGNWALSSLVTLSANQTTGLTVGSPIMFDTISGDHTISNYKVKVKGGQKAEFIGRLTANFSSGGTQNLITKWYNVTSGVYIGAQGVHDSRTDANQYTTGVDAVAIDSPLVDSEYELRVTAATALNNIQYLYSSASVHSTLPGGVVFSGTADKTVANTTSETSLIPTGVGSATLAANSFSAGKVLRIRLSGKYGTKTAPAGDITIKVKLGSTVVNTSGTHSVDPGETDQFWTVDLCLTCRTTGASGTVIGQTSWNHSVAGAVSTAMQVAPMVANSAVTIDTTTSQAVDVTAQWSTANASNTITTTCCQIEWMN
jgi:hypothetical protein